MSYILQLSVILGVSFVGEALHALLPLPVPASVYGLCLLFVLLCTGVVSVDFLRPTASFLIGLLPLLLVPGTVGIMQAWSMVRSALVPLVISFSLITVCVMAAAGLVAQRLEGGAKHDRVSE